MLNPPARMKVAYDSGVRNWFDPGLIQKLPVTMKPGDSLVSTISMPKGLVLHAQLRNKIERGVDDSSPIRAAAVLTCVSAAAAARRVSPGLLRQAGRRSFWLATSSASSCPAAALAEHAPDRAVHPVHRAAMGGNLLLRLRGARGKHAAIRARVRPGGRPLRPPPVHRPPRPRKRSRCW